MNEVQAKEGFLPVRGKILMNSYIRKLEIGQNINELNLKALHKFYIRFLDQVANLRLKRKEKH